MSGKKGRWGKEVEVRRSNAGARVETKARAKALTTEAQRLHGECLKEGRGGVEVPPRKSEHSYLHLQTECFAWLN